MLPDQVCELYFESLHLFLDLEKTAFHLVDLSVVGWLDGEVIGITRWEAILHAVFAALRAPR